MRIYFSGIGGVGIGPLAEIALDAGHQVTGSDPYSSLMTQQLEARGITVSTTQDGDFLASEHAKAPFDWYIYTAALLEDHPELQKARALGIQTGKRDELLVDLLEKHKLKLIAVSGTHGKTNTTGMVVWTLKQLGIPVSYSVGTTLGFGPSGAYDPASEYFVYECDEFDRNMLKFHPHLSIITSIDYDHPDTYATEEEYRSAFRQFIHQSEASVLWQADADYLQTREATAWCLQPDEIRELQLVGALNRRNASLVLKAFERLGIGENKDNTLAIESFPGTNRRFEKLDDNLYSDYGHHPIEIAATLQMARELSDHVVLIYQPHQNIRQHEVRAQYTDCMELADEIYWLPTYQSREDPSLEVLTPEQLSESLTNKKSVHVAELDNALWDSIQRHRDQDKLVLCMGAGSIDAWLRDNKAIAKVASVIVVDTDNNFILQQRDHNPGISFPGKITGFGGAIENDESLREGAVRELSEETNLEFTADELEYNVSLYQTGTFDGKPRWLTYFTLRDADISALEVYEGEGFVSMNSSDDLSQFNFAPAVHEAVEKLTK